MKQKQNKTNTPDKKNSIKNYSFDKEKKENLDEISSLNYFKIKGMEKEKNYHENNRKENNPEYRNLTEKIYSSNLAKLGNYYNNNQKDLLLYGSKKYDYLEIQRLVKEMSKYKNKVITKIKENKKNKNVCKNYAFESCDEKVILTPLAERDSNKNNMEKLEKKKFDEAERCGVVMRRIEYANLLDHRDSFISGRNSLEEDKEMLLLMKDAVDCIERNWIRYRNNKNKINKIDEVDNEDGDKDEEEDEDEEKDENNNFTNNIHDNNGISKLNKIIKEHFYFQLLSNKNPVNIKKDKNRCYLYKFYKISEFEQKDNKKKYIEELENKINEEHNNYIETKNILDNLDSENKQLQLLLKNTKKDNIESDKQHENEEEKNNEENQQDDLLKKYKDINDKYDQKVDDYLSLSKIYNKLVTDNNNLKSNYDKLLQNHNILNEKYNEILEDNKMKNYEINNNKNDQEKTLKKYNQNLQKINKLSNIIEDINTKKNEYTNNNNFLLNDKIKSKEKENLNNDIYYLKKIIDEKEKEIEGHKNAIKNLKNYKNNEYEKEIINLKKQIYNNDKINKNQITNYEKQIELLNNRINSLEYEKEEFRKTSNDLENISPNNINKYKELLNQYKNEINKLNEKNDKLNNDIEDLKQKLNKENNDINNEINNNNVYNNENNKYYELLQIKKKHEEKIDRLNKIIEELKNRIQDLYLELSDLKRNGLDIILRNKLFALLIQKHIDKNIIFDKRKFLNFLLKKQFRLNNMNLRNNIFINDRKYKNGDNSLSKLFQSKSKEKKIEYLRSSNKKEGPY